MAFFLAEIDWKNPLFLAIGIALILGVLAVCAVKVVKANRDSKRAKSERERAEKEEGIKEGVEEVLREIRDEYLVMSRGTTYAVGPDGYIAAGRYIIKNSVEGGGPMNVRLNGFVQVINDGDIVTVGVGDSICPVSGSVLLKPYLGDASAK